MDDADDLSVVARMLRLMPPYDDSRTLEAIRPYAEHPLDDGDAVLVLDDAVCVELGGVADHWDDLLRRSTGHVLRENRPSRVVVAIARRGAELRPGDFQIWRDLHAELRGTAVELLPVRALPAA